MKTWVGERARGASPAYRFEDLPRPVPGPGEVLIRVRAVGLSLVDRFPKRQHFQHSAPSPAAIPGMEVAGDVVDTSARVMAMVHAGCAEYAVAHESLLMPMPASMSFADAAAIPVAFLTAHDALATQGRLGAGQAVLIQGVTTGVGLAAVQLAKVHGAGLIAGTSRSPEKLERTRALGLSLGIPSGEGVADAVLAATGGRGADVVLDHLGARALKETLRATAIGGRVVNIGRYAGARGEIDLETLALRRISLIGVTFRTRSLAEHAAVVRAFLAQHAKDLESGALRPVIDSALPFDQLPQAIAKAERGEQFGKLVLEL
ncbi:MAG: quinone oxidoreductase family protein [Betaproteobacteria bacterium]